MAFIMQKFDDGCIAFNYDGGAAGKGDGVFSLVSSYYPPVSGRPEGILHLESFKATYDPDYPGDEEMMDISSAPTDSWRISSVESLDPDELRDFVENEFFKKGYDV